MNVQTQVLDRDQQDPTAIDPAAGLKNILLHVQDDQSLDLRLEAALSIARCFSSHLTCLQVTPTEAYVAFDNFGGVFVMSDVITALDEREEALREKLEADLANEGVSWEYRHSVGNVAGTVASHAALADLIVTSREAHRTDRRGPVLTMLGDLLRLTRTPILIPGATKGTIDPLGKALIAYDGSLEAANAVRAALPLLRQASEVRIIRVEEEQKAGTFPGTVLLEYLSRHGIRAELRLAAADKDLIPYTIIDDALRFGAEYIVMGGYGHSRVGEFLFGGVTRSLLKDCPVPLVIAR